MPEVSPRTLGMLIALYERVVGLYASLIGINAYHQPGVEAGKKAAGGVIALKLRLIGGVAPRARALPSPRNPSLSASASRTRPNSCSRCSSILQPIPATRVRKNPKSPWWESTYTYIT